MSDFVTTAWVSVSFIFLLSLLMLFLEIDLGPGARIVGGIGLGLSGFLGFSVLLVYGLPPDLLHFVEWFFGGFVSIMLLVGFLYTVRWLLPGPSN